MFSMKLLLKGSKEKLSLDAAGFFNIIAVKEMEILDHIEKILSVSGILIATSNLIQNMDKAYERRFLFKFTFEKPCMESRKNIQHGNKESIYEKN